MNFLEKKVKKDGKVVRNAKFEQKNKFLTLTPLEFELILKEYGMTKSAFCALRGKSPSWFYNYFRTLKYVKLRDVELLADTIGKENFVLLAGQRVVPAGN